MLGVMAADTVGLAALTEALQDGPLPGAVDKALDLFDGLEGRLIVAGVGKSGLVGRKLAATFSSTGTPACFVHPAEASHGDLGMISGNDVVLLVSWSGETRELSDILQYARRFGVPVISITSVATSSLARSSDVALVLPRVPEACPHNLAPTTSTLLQMALGDALALTLLRERGFSEENFRDFHPGGKLGAALTPVSDIMITGDRMPLVRPDTPLIDALGEISKKSLGICGVCGPDGSLAGVITDGDIRRYLESRSEGTMKATLWEAKADRLMTPGSIVLEPAHLSARALHVLQSNKIAAAFAINAGRPVGVVTLNRLLTLGVA
ncbi:MAG: KpsF/GutQ family sugar-phosphate isomerase [Rhodobacteraceae bacterium]|nr:KpsF/GutQ family sugar-phosphate isomerase [Paracoccaceae bacterium]